MNIPRLYHTIRYLKPRQISAQIFQRLRTRLENPSHFLAHTPPSFPGCVWTPVTSFLPPGDQINKKEQIVDGFMTFLNHTHDIGWMPEWRKNGLSKLWRYNLHYFEWIWAFSQEDFESSKAVCLDWIRQNKPERLQVGWEPYPTTLRLMNWCLYFFAEHRNKTLADKNFTAELWRSIWQQTEWLSTHLEYHLMGNHLLEDAAALAIAGSCFDGDFAVRWRETGIKLLQKQLNEQMLDDGMHFERSPMYHSRILYVLLILHNTGEEELQHLVSPFIMPALNALSDLTHPDGNIALLNDSAEGVYNDPFNLITYGRRLGFNCIDKFRGSWALMNAGYYGFKSEHGNYIVCDAGRLGPDYIPGHAHADIFSFELSLLGTRVIVDSGVHDYEWSAERSYCRSTAAHNTVEINGQDQAEMWGAFRVARRGYPNDVDWKPNISGFLLTARHNGYRRLPGKPLHQRTFVYSDGDYLKITDIIITNHDVTCRSYIHLHPSCRCNMMGNNVVSVLYPAGEFAISYKGSGRLDIQRSEYYPQFGKKFSNEVLVYTWVSKPSQTTLEYIIEMS